MHRPLFAHGPLGDPDLLAAVLGRSIPPVLRLPAKAPGFAAVSLAEGRRAALVRRPGEAVGGLVLLGLSGFEIDLLDAFEAEHCFRGIVPVMIEAELHEADAYLPRAAAGEKAEAWSLSGWQERHRAVALGVAKTAATALRARLIAIRPH